MGVIGRAAAGAADFYAAWYDHTTTQYKLARINAGTATSLGTAYTHTLTSTPENIELRMSGNDISVYVDAVLRIGPVTDGSPITSAGKSGIRLFAMRETGIADAGSLDNFSAVDAGGGGGGSLFRTNPGGQLSGLGSGGKFFQNPLQRTADAWQRIRGIFVSRSYNPNGI